MKVAPLQQVATVSSPKLVSRHFRHKRRTVQSGSRFPLSDLNGLLTGGELDGLVATCLAAVIVSNASRATTLSVDSLEQVRKPAAKVRRPVDLDWGACSDIGPRDYMEDAYQVVKGPDHFFAAVYDGHGGCGSSTYLRSNFYKFVSAMLGKNRKLLSDETTTDDEMNTIFEKSMSEVFMAADSALIDYIATLGDPECWSGSTATVCVVNSSLLMCANVGDSRAVLCRSGKPVDISADHRPTTSSSCGRCEIKRINQAGGWISQSRVCGILAVTRAFGDYEFKGGRYELLEELKDSSDILAMKASMEGPPVISLPHCFTIPRSTEDEFIILASDGLWDTMNSAQAVTFVRSELKKDPSKSMQDIADALIARALRCRTQDNVVCIVVKLSR